jgi:hypothetical protein
VDIESMKFKSRAEAADWCKATKRTALNSARGSKKPAKITHQRPALSQGGAFYGAGEGGCSTRPPFHQHSSEASAPWS